MEKSSFPSKRVKKTRDKKIPVVFHISVQATILYVQTTRQEKNIQKGKYAALQKTSMLFYMTTQRT